MLSQFMRTKICKDPLEWPLRFIKVSLHQKITSKFTLCFLFVDLPSAFYILGPSGRPFKVVYSYDPELEQLSAEELQIPKPPRFLKDLEMKGFRLGF